MLKLQKNDLNITIRFATFLQNSGIAIVFVFMPIYAKSMTESLFEVGVVVASFSLAQILSGLYFGRISDKRQDRVHFIRYGFLGCSIIFMLHYFADSASLLLIMRLVAGVTSGVMIPAMLAYAYESGDGQKKVASIVSFQALGWLIGIVAAGFINDEKIIFLVSSGFFTLGFLVSLRLKNINHNLIDIDDSTKNVITKNKYLFLSLLLRHTGASAVWTVLPIMLMEHLGAELYQISIVYVANNLTAFVLMNMMAKRIHMSDSSKFKLGIGLTTFVFVGIALSNSWWLVIPAMILVGISWAFLYIGGNFYLMKHNPKSTSTGIFSSTIAIATVIGPLIAGTIAFLTGFTNVMIFAVIINIAAFVISLKIEKPIEIVKN